MLYLGCGVEFGLVAGDGGGVVCVCVCGEGRVLCGGWCMVCVW